MHGARVVGGMQKPHDKGERAVGFMVSTTTGTGGGVRGLKDRRSLALRAWSGRTGDSAHVLDCLCPGMVLRDVCGLPTRTLSPSVQLTRTTTEQQRQHREQAGREASWLKQVRKVKRVGESEKWVTRPRGEE